MLFEIKVQIVSVAILEDSAKGIGVNLEHVVQFHYPRMVQRLVNIVLPQCVPKNGNARIALNNRFTKSTRTGVDTTIPTTTTQRQANEFH